MMWAIRKGLDVQYFKESQRCSPLCLVPDSPVWSWEAFRTFQVTASLFTLLCLPTLSVVISAAPLLCHGLSLTPPPPWSYRFPTYLCLLSPVCRLVTPLRFPSESVFCVWVAVTWKHTCHHTTPCHDMAPWGKQTTKATLQKPWYSLCASALSHTQHPTYHWLPKEHEQLICSPQCLQPHALVH